MAEEYKIKKQLKKLDDQEFKEDIKKFIKSSHEFYSSRVPELKILANRLHEEHELTDFYKLFNKFWNSNHPKEVSLAIYTLQLYKDDFTLETWNFIKKKFNEIKAWDKADAIGMSIVGEIFLKHPEIEPEILEYSSGKNNWLKRLSLMSTIPIVKNGDFSLALKIIEKNLFSKNDFMNKPMGTVLREIGDKNPGLLKEFVLKNINMPLPTFLIATENSKELRKERVLKKPVYDRFGKFMFWKKV